MRAYWGGRGGEDDEDDEDDGEGDGNVLNSNSVSNSPIPQPSSRSQRRRRSSLSSALHRRLSSLVSSSSVASHTTSSPPPSNNLLPAPAAHALFTRVASELSRSQYLFSSLSGPTPSFGSSTPSLQSATFGLFPALPTLDPHYVSHLRLLSLSEMRVGVYRAVRDLEDVARRREGRTRDMLGMVRRGFGVYGIEEGDIFDDLRKQTDREEDASRRVGGRGGLRGRFLG